MTILRQSKEYTIRLSRANPEDIPLLIQIVRSAFAPNLFNQLIDAAHPDGDEDFANKVLEYLSMPNVVVMKAEVTSAGLPRRQIVAWSVWGWSDENNRLDVTAPAVDLGVLSAGLVRASINQDLPAGSLAKMFNDGERLWAQRWLTHRDFMILGLLCVAPQFQGRGIGERILDWGTKEADRRGLVCCLTATPVAWQIYERFGWNVVAEQRLDLSEWFSSKGLERRENDQAAKDMGYGIYIWRRMIRLPQRN
ncbi:hypothetical protein MMC12_006926 [Toensbergia leucococca]|nr:hypothetical protein [Toensbergia leucococca]